MATNITGSSGSRTLTANNSVGDVSWSITNYDGIPPTQILVSPPTGPSTTLKWEDVPPGTYNNISVTATDSRMTQVSPACCQGAYAGHCTSTATFSLTVEEGPSVECYDNINTPCSQNSNYPNEFNFYLDCGSMSCYGNNIQVGTLHLRVLNDGLPEGVVTVVSCEGHLYNPATGMDLTSVVGRVFIGSSISVGLLRSTISLYSGQGGLHVPDGVSGFVHGAIRIVNRITTRDGRTGDFEVWVFINQRDKFWNLRPIPFQQY